MSGRAAASQGATAGHVVSRVPVPVHRGVQRAHCQPSPAVSWGDVGAHRLAPAEPTATAASGDRLLTRRHRGAGPHL